MPPRFAYWTILAGGLPTSFRAADKAELMPTFRRLKEKHPDAEMKYFARGKLWESADEARSALIRTDRPSGHGREGRPDGERERRGRDWRPGGEHRDPRQPFQDAKKARNQDRRDQRWRRKNEDRRSGPRDAPEPQPHRSPPKPFRGSQAKPFTGGQGRAPRNKPHGDKLRDEVPRRRFQPAGDRRFGRNQESAPRPPRPDREPPPEREPKPGPPPRPSEPAIKPPGPPERGDQSKVNRRPHRRKRER